MPTDAENARFLYTIIKQLNLKCVRRLRTLDRGRPDAYKLQQINWNEVSQELGITNGHAARMRYSRFRQQVDGITPTPRGPRKRSAEPKRARRHTAAKGKLEKHEDTKDDPEYPNIKRSASQEPNDLCTAPKKRAKTKPDVKDEIDEDDIPLSQRVRKSKHDPDAIDSANGADVAGSSFSESTALHQHMYASWVGETPEAANPCVYGEGPPVLGPLDNETSRDTYGSVDTDGREQKRNQPSAIPDELIDPALIKAEPGLG